MQRKGFLEETYFTYSYSPVPGDTGGVGGILVSFRLPVGVAPGAALEARAPGGQALLHHSTGDAFLQGGGELGELMRSTDWGKTPLGPVETWPQSLRTASSMALPSKFAMVIVWGSGRSFPPEVRAWRPLQTGSPCALLVRSQGPFRG
jgi:hypothetical protein